MLTLTLGAALAAEGPLQVEGMPTHYRVEDADGAIEPWEFANVTGDDEVIELYRRSNSLRKTIAVTGWVGGGVLAYAGLVGIVLGGTSGSPPLMGLGLMAGMAGFTTIGLGTVNQVAWGRRLDDYETWWTYDEAMALAEAYNATLTVEPEELDQLSILESPRGFMAADRHGRLNTGEFAERVGDRATYLRWNSIRVACNITGWTAFGVGLVMASNTLPMALDDLGRGQVPDPLIGTLALLGTGALIGGPLFVYGSKLVYNDVNRFYTRDEAETWVRAPLVSVDPKVHVEVYPTALVMRW